MNIPAITPEYLETRIASEQYLHPTPTLTICVLTMANGLYITGESACLDPARFDAKLGRQYARKKAVDKLWELEGYARACGYEAPTSCPDVSFVVNNAFQPTPEQSAAILEALGRNCSCRKGTLI